jgi:hypothetical protein
LKISTGYCRIMFLSGLKVLTASQSIQDEPVLTDKSKLSMIRRELEVIYNI